MDGGKISIGSIIKYALLFSVIGILNLFGSVQVNGSVSNLKKDSIVVKGIVFDEYDIPLRNVSVSVKKSHTETFTNEKGEFSISVKPGAKLVFSCTGKVEKTCKVKNEVLLFVKMVNDKNSATEIIINEGVFEEDNDIFMVVEEMPRLPEGNVDEYIAKNLKYPEKAREKKIEGRVAIQFVIEKTGKISNVRVLRSIHPLLDAEAVRIIENMPDWVPGKQRGQTVRVAHTVIVNFKL